MIRLSYGEKTNGMLSRFHLIPERNGHAHRRTDRRTDLLYQYRASVCYNERLKNLDFRPMSRIISEMIRDRAIVTMECELETVRKLPNGTINNDLE